jgi:hypothetical protein
MRNGEGGCVAQFVVFGVMGMGRKIFSKFERF